LIIVETNNQTYADKIVEEVKAVYSDQKIYVVADAKKENANYIKAGLEKAVKNPNIDYRQFSCRYSAGSKYDDRTVCSCYCHFSQ
jgi:hypothetical protein